MDVTANERIEDFLRRFLTRSPSDKDDIIRSVRASLPSVVAEKGPEFDHAVHAGLEHLKLRG